MLKGEEVSSRVIYELKSDFIPEPFAFGQYKKPDPAAFFYLDHSILTRTIVHTTICATYVRSTHRLMELTNTTLTPILQSLVLALYRILLRG